jgi:hypothetical protein
MTMPDSSRAFFLTPLTQRIMSAARDIRLRAGLSSLETTHYAKRQSKYLANDFARYLADSGLGLRA